MVEVNASLSLQHPVSFWNRPLKVDARGFFVPLMKAIGHKATGKWIDAAGDVSSSLSAVGLQTKPEEIAWLLIHRSLKQALYNLVAENADLLSEKTPTNAAEISQQLDAAIEQEQVQIDSTFFNQPKGLPLLQHVQRDFKHWLRCFDMVEARAATVVERVPTYFVYALHKEWRDNSAFYTPITTAINTPFVNAVEKEQAWNYYYAFLNKQVEESVFDESFSLSQVYVPLRAYFDRKKEGMRRDEELDRIGYRDRNTERVVIPLKATLDAWLNEGDQEDAVRVLSGDPGSGKSSFAKMYASYQTTNPNTRVLFIPLHLFDAEGDLADSVANFVRTSRLLSSDLMDTDKGETRLLLIFDGLDELAMQGKVGESIARDFVKKVIQTVGRRNYYSLHIQALISGRTVVVQNNAGEFIKEGQILHLLPYYLTEEQRKNYVDEQNLLAEDQRTVWWQGYGKAIGPTYDSMPQELQREDLDDITAQPLLNYLVALSLKRGKIDFSQEINLNVIYDDLISAVYERGYAHQRHAAIGNIDKRNFIRLLEDVGVAAWHGNGRTTTISQIEAHCAVNGKVPNWDVFEEGAKSGITRLLTAFYFRQHSRTTENEPTFEFTHKSFGEYLTARRIVRGLDVIYDERRRNDEDRDRGYDEKKALVEWARLCGPSETTYDIFRLLCNEIILRDKAEVRQWQTMLASLIAYMLRNGMPMEELPNVTPFREQTRQDRNSEAAMLAALNACAKVTKTVSNIQWPTDYSVRDWLVKLQTRGRSIKDYFVADLLSYMNFDNCFMPGFNFFHSKLENSSFVGAILNASNFRNANVQGGDFRRAQLHDVDFGLAQLQGANFRDAEMRGTNFAFSILVNTNFADCVMDEVDFKDADLSYANMSGSDVSNARLEGANLEDAQLDGVTFASHNKFRQLRMNFTDDNIELFSIDYRSTSPSNALRLIRARDRKLSNR